MYEPSKRPKFIPPSAEAYENITNSDTDNEVVCFAEGYLQNIQRIERHEKALIRSKKIGLMLLKGMSIAFSGFGFGALSPTVVNEVLKYKIKDQTDED